MSDSVARGKRLQRRRIGLGINSVNEFCKRTGVSRNAITGAERGNASESTFVRLEAWLDQHGAPPLTDEQQRVEIGATVDHNGHRITITAAGPPGTGDELARVVIGAVSLLRNRD